MPPENSGEGDLTLPELVLSLKGDRTYKELEAASGGIVKSQRWNQLANGARINQFPEPQTLEAIAAALPCDIEVLILACARTVGIGVRRRRSRFVDMLPPSVDDLSERSKAALLNLARTLSEAEQTPPEGGAGKVPAGATAIDTKRTTTTEKLTRLDRARHRPPL